MTKRFLVPGAAGAMSFFTASARAAAISSWGGAASWVVPTSVALASATVLVVAVLLWRRRVRAASEAIQRARSRALHRHTERLATQIAEPDF